MAFIKLTLPDGKQIEHPKGITGEKIAMSIGPRLAKAALAIEVDGEVWDLFRPIEKDSKIRILTFSDDGGKYAFRHSTAHVLAHAVQRLFPHVKNTIGPPVEEGFYYDFDFGDYTLTPEDFPKIEAEMKKVAEFNYRFERVEWTLADVKKHQGQNQYKQELAKDFAQKGLALTAYKDGDFIDLCEGPHVASTGLIKAFKLTKIAGAYWRGDQKNKQLTRIYGISFPSQKELDEHLRLLEEAEKRDHRKLGKEHKLFMFHEWSPGSPFLLPRGTIVYNELLRFIRAQYQERGYHEVVTPQLFNKKLWELSGHWEHYKDNMFLLKVDSEEFSLKPMNCPSHVLMFKNETRSYRDLPWRVADFCMLHRNELKGVLGGMTRCRKFSQDDAHIFCAPEQIRDEISGVLHFVKHVYKDVFKMEFQANLSTRPDQFMGDIKVWDKAEAALADALNSNKIAYKVKEKEGAFYGPKIDFDVKDSLGRLWQCATVQLDFQMPLRMGAEYEGADGKKHPPVMIHRAVLGSLERFFAVMVEHYAGKFPLWLSPEQVRLLLVTERVNDYAQKTAAQMRDAGLRVTIDANAETIGKKVRDAQLAQVNYILVIGDKEVQDGTVTVRTRDGIVHGAKTVIEFIDSLKQEAAEKR